MNYKLYTMNYVSLPELLLPLLPVPPLLDQGDRFLDCVQLVLNTDTINQRIQITGIALNLQYSENMTYPVGVKTIYPKSPPYGSRSFTEGREGMVRIFMCVQKISGRQSHDCVQFPPEISVLICPHCCTPNRYNSLRRILFSL